MGTLWEKSDDWILPLPDFAADHIQNLRNGYDAVEVILLGCIDLIEQGRAEEASALMEREVKSLRLALLLH